MTTKTKEPPRLARTACTVCGRPGDPLQTGQLCMASIQHPDGTRSLCNGTIMAAPESEVPNGR